MNFPPPSERQARLIWLALTGCALGLIVALIAATVWGLGLVLRLLSPVLWPIAVAGILAYLLDPVVDFLESRKISRPRGIIFVFALALAIVAGIAAGVIPQMVSETRELVQRIPSYAERMEKQLDDWISHPPTVVQQLFDRTSANSTNTPTALAASSTNAPAKIFADKSTLAAFLGDDSVKSAAQWLAKSAGSAAKWLFGQFSIVASLFGIIAGISLVPVYAFYFLLEKEGIQSRWTDYLPVSQSDIKDEVVFILRSINDYLIAFFRGQLLVAVIDSVLYTTGFLLIGLPYALLIGVMAIPLTMIPFLGAVIVCLTAVVMAFASSGGWVQPALVLAVFAVVQTIEGLVVSPKIMGDRVGLHPLVIIIAVMVGTTLLGGILGGILAIPLAAALRVIMFRYVWKKRVA